MARDARATARSIAPSTLRLQVKTGKGAEVGEADGRGVGLRPACSSEDGGRRTEDRGQRTEDRGQRTEDRGRKTEDRGRKTEDRGRRTEDAEDGGSSTCGARNVRACPHPLAFGSRPLPRGRGQPIPWTINVQGALPGTMLDGEDALWSVPSPPGRGRGRTRPPPRHEAGIPTFTSGIRANVDASGTRMYGESAPSCTTGLREL